ncbi:hypothetical protein DL764_006607 [Monosporascus ibericus]|uniref:BZIP domain-containing protein n=1 Tax=Monosporascus ibericus TaxID=155417 RepID=A0A4Q4T819_9PEZI|nr:hypothetical protein DL764_006607 [Monosporascus ibericus]
MSIRPLHRAHPSASIGQTIVPPHLIPLQLMPQQADAGPGSDWTGISDPKARKRIQDRIHQRNSRKGQRKKARTGLSSGSVEGSCHAPAFSATTQRSPHGSFSEHQPTTSLSAGNVVCMARQSRPLDLSSFTACEPESERTEWFILQFTTNAHRDFLYGSPRVDMLLNLVQFNTTRALVMNARAIGITHELMAPGSRSQFAPEGVNVATHNSLPSSLKPTLLQLTVNHHPWIDILPFPEIRDNLLRHDENSYDKKELCRDLRGFQAVADGYGGMIAWGDPWDSRGWEVTEAFAFKWPWVVKDCHELLESTNYWRAINFPNLGSCRGLESFICLLEFELAHNINSAFFAQFKNPALGQLNAPAWHGTWMSLAPPPISETRPYGLTAMRQLRIWVESPAFQGVMPISGWPQRRPPRCPCSALSSPGPPAAWFIERIENDPDFANLLNHILEDRK